MTPRILDRSRPRTSLLDFTPEAVKAFLREKFAAKGVEEAYVFGSFASGQGNPWSDLDVVVVMPTAVPFVERPREFPEIFDLGVPVDLLVYTPEEFRQISQSESPFWKNFQRQKIRII